MNIRFLTIIFSLFACLLNAQTTTEKVIWDYPVKPMTEEWRQLSTYAEMKNACLIPVDILEKMPTKELVEVCLNYPLRFKFYVYDNLHLGLKEVVKDFNGLQELLMRKDNAQYLYELLQEVCFETLPEKNLPSLEIGRLIISYTLKEVMLAHELVLIHASVEQQKAIAALAARSMSLKELRSEDYSRHSLEASAYLLCASLKRMNPNILTPDLELFLQTGSLRNEAQIKELKQLYSETINP